MEKLEIYPSSKPWTRWWWFSGEIRDEDIKYQLDWLSRNGFGGVEIAWVYPQPDSKPGTEWLSDAWSAMVAFTKRYAESIGLGCDYTFGSLWPFGGSMVRREDSSRVYGGYSGQRLRGTWEDPFIKEPGYILNHLDHNALEKYSSLMGNALKEALKGRKSALFCDSWEIETEELWTDGFDSRFEDEYGYSIHPYMKDIDANPHVRYDYRKLIAHYILHEFYAPFTEICHSLGAMSRVQCHGSPTDLLATYGTVDIPETEAILFEPPFARIAASAAALTGKPIVSSETFTCLYGWVTRSKGKGPHLKEERVGCMKQLCDALFANGVNQVFWHGMPYNPEGGKNEFYATVHVGPDSAFASDVASFNKYMETVCDAMRRGRSYTDVAVYLPIEDAWMAGELPPGNYAPDTKYHWEFRFTRMPEDLKGNHPTWVSGHYLKDAVFEKGELKIGDVEFRKLVVKVDWLDEESLTSILRLARLGLSVCLENQPNQPGKKRTTTFPAKLRELMSLPNVTSDCSLRDDSHALVEGNDLPDFHCRVDGENYVFFFANPKAMNLHYPMIWGQAKSRKTTKIPIKIRVGEITIEHTLVFEPVQSLLLEVTGDGKVTEHDISYTPVNL